MAKHLMNSMDIMDTGDAAEATISNSTELSTGNAAEATTGNTAKAVVPKKISWLGRMESLLMRPLKQP